MAGPESGEEAEAGPQGQAGQAEKGEGEAEVVCLTDQQLQAVLVQIRDNIHATLAQPGLLEPAWSIADRRLIREIDVVITGLQELARRRAPQEAA